MKFRKSEIRYGVPKRTLHEKTEGKMKIRVYKIKKKKSGPSFCLVFYHRDSVQVKLGTEQEGEPANIDAEKTEEKTNVV